MKKVFILYQYHTTDEGRTMLIDIDLAKIVKEVKNRMANYELHENKDGNMPIDAISPQMMDWLWINQYEVDETSMSVQFREVLQRDAAGELFEDLSDF